MTSNYFQWPKNVFLQLAALHLDAGNWVMYCQAGKGAQLWDALNFGTAKKVTQKDYLYIVWSLESRYICVKTIVSSFVTWDKWTYDTFHAISSEILKRNSIFFTKELRIFFKFPIQFEFDSMFIILVVFSMLQICAFSFWCCDSFSRSDKLIASIAY